MNNTLKYILIGLAGVIIGFAISYLLISKPATGGETNFGGSFLVGGTDASGNTNTLTVGSSGSAITQLNFGSCNLQPDAATIAASTTARVTCHGGSWATGQSAYTALTGITSSSKIVASLSSTTAGTTFEGLVLTGVTASTTSGFIETRISNQTGATYTWPVSGSASGTMQYIGTK